VLVGSACGGVGLSVGLVCWSAGISVDFADTTDRDGEKTVAKLRQAAITFAKADLECGIFNFPPRIKLCKILQNLHYRDIDDMLILGKK
jgi:hypothetical protein